MQYRRLGKTGYEVSEIGFGAWAIGGCWGGWTTTPSLRALHAAVDAGVNLIDTADVYGDGRSERLIGRLLRERAGERIYVATKMGRRVPQLVENYTPEAFAGWLAAQPREPGRRAHRPRPAALPADRGLLPPGGLRGPRRAGGRRRHRPLRRQRGEGGGGAQGHRVPGRRERPDHLQHRPPAPGRALPGRGRGAATWASWRACRWPPACSPAS